MFRALYLHQLVQRLLAIEAAANNPVLEQFTVKDSTDGVVVDGWKLAGDLYYNLVSDQIATNYPLTNQVILSRTGNKDDYELQTAAVLAEEYLQFTGLVGSVESLIADCWALVGLGMVDDGNVPEPEAPVEDATKVGKRESSAVRLVVVSENTDAAELVFRRGDMVNMVGHLGNLEVISAFDVEVGMTLHIGDSGFDLVTVNDLAYFLEPAPEQAEEFQPTSLD